jgi:hypothetical protein
MNLFPLLFGVVLLAVAVAAGAAARRAYARIRRIRRLPTVPVGSLPAEGPAEVSGRAAGATQPSLITKTPCVFWQAEVEELRKRGKNSTWVTILKRQSDTLFQVEDGTGHVSVLPANAELVLADDVTDRQGFLNDFDAVSQDALERLGIRTEGLFGANRSLRVRERYLKPGDRVFVLGFVERMNGEPILGSVSGEPLILTDRSEGALLAKYWLEAVGYGILTGVVFVFGALAIIGSFG